MSTANDNVRYREEIIVRLSVVLLRIIHSYFASTLHEGDNWNLAYWFV